ncbi:MAG: glycosyltransferase [Clostridiales Family XIII bacterium]|jgi:glycosyltransferase involved in cell wall biosynthesis|nr:glycosyltransferase [Clostridiales Family XIII bacterium]
MPANLTFVVCAYKESAFLEDTVRRLLSQTLPARVLISTSTPNGLIDGVAKKYGVGIRVNPDGGTSAKDWNFAYAQAETDFVTLAHQDDVYEPAFAEKTMAAIENSKNPIAAYTDYYELRYKEKGGGGRRIETNRILRVKRFMLGAIRLRQNSIWLRNRVLSFGYPMNCPGTTYNKKRIPEIGFRPDWQNSHDWDAICRLAKLPGDFIFVKELLLGHRIYAESQTTNTIGSGQRAAEDLVMFEKYWPKPIARLIMGIYRTAYDSNRL